MQAAFLMLSYTELTIHLPHAICFISNRGTEVDSQCCIEHCVSCYQRLDTALFYSPHC